MGEAARRLPPWEPVLVLLRLLDGDICDSRAMVGTLGHHDLQHSVVHLGLQKCTPHLSELTFGCVTEPGLSSSIPALLSGTEGAPLQGLLRPVRPEDYIKISAAAIPM